MLLIQGGNMSRNSTSLGQRVAIWLIAIIMLGGTITGMIFMVLASRNPELSPEQIAMQREQEEFERWLESEEHQELLEEQRRQQEEHQRRLRGLEGFEHYVEEFDSYSITGLEVRVLREGSGATVASGADLTVHYTGWTPDGRIFDSTRLVDQDSESVSFNLAGLIEGWSRGLVGTRAGGIYLLSIPSDLAYGEAGAGDMIPPNTPLRFLVHVVDVVNN